MAQELDDVADPAERDRLEAQRETDADIEAREGSWSRRWVVLALVMVAAFLGLVAWAVISGTARDERAAQGGPEAWTSLGGPDTSVGSTTAYTRCLGYNRLVIVVGADGFPVGPATVIEHGHGSGCNP